MQQLASWVPLRSVCFPEQQGRRGTVRGRRKTAYSSAFVTMTTKISPSVLLMFSSLQVCLPIYRQPRSKDSRRVDCRLFQFYRDNQHATRAVEHLKENGLFLGQESHESDNSTSFTALQPYSLRRTRASHPSSTIGLLVPHSGHATREPLLVPPSDPDGVFVYHPNEVQRELPFTGVHCYGEGILYQVSIPRTYR